MASPYQSQTASHQTFQRKTFCLVGLLKGSASQTPSFQPVVATGHEQHAVMEYSSREWRCCRTPDRPSHPFCCCVPWLETIKAPIFISLRTPPGSPGIGTE